jgi:hypothetical protein
MFVAAGTRLEHYVSTQIKSSAWMTGNPHLTLVSVGCCSRALDRRSETQIFVDPGTFTGTNLARTPRNDVTSYEWELEV